MGRRFLFFLLVAFFFTCAKVQVGGPVAGALHPVQDHKARTDDRLGAGPASLEQEDFFKKAAISRPLRGRSIAAVADRYLPDAALPCPALPFPDLEVWVKGQPGTCTEALFCFLQSLLYPKHSFW